VAGLPAKWDMDINARHDVKQFD